MNAVAGAAENFYLQPGALYAGRRPLLLRTFLGSCVALTVWHAPTGMAAMCHFVLPARPGVTALPRDCDGRYGSDALQFLDMAVRATDPVLAHCQWSVFGGATLWPRPASQTSPGLRNLAQVWAWLLAQDLEPEHVDVAGRGSRLLQLDTRTGVTQVRYTPVQFPDEGREVHHKRSAR